MCLSLENMALICSYNYLWAKLQTGCSNRLFKLYPWQCIDAHSWKSFCCMWKYAWSSVSKDRVKELFTYIKYSCGYFTVFATNIFTLTGIMQMRSGCQCEWIYSLFQLLLIYAIPSSYTGFLYKLMHKQ